jgi:hypothetical protein
MSHPASIMKSFDFAVIVPLNPCPSLNDSSVSKCMWVNTPSTLNDIMNRFVAGSGGKYAVKMRSDRSASSRVKIFSLYSARSSFVSKSK